MRPSDEAHRSSGRYPGVVRAFTWSTCTLHVGRRVSFPSVGVGTQIDLESLQSVERTLRYSALISIGVYSSNNEGLASSTIARYEAHSS